MTYGWHPEISILLMEISSTHGTPQGWNERSTCAFVKATYVIWDLIVKRNICLPVNPVVHGKNIYSLTRIPPSIPAVAVPCKEQ